MIEELIKEIRNEIFSLALQSPDLETMHWYIALDDCFENDEFSKEGDNGISSIVWRCQVLNWKHQLVNKLLWMVDNLFREAGYEVRSCEDISEPLIIKEVSNGG